jgi:hypothetical protein
MIIAIDFDGTIVNDRFPDLGMLLPDAKRVINTMHDDGHFIIIWTCRSGQKLLECVNFLLEHGICFDRVNDQMPAHRAKYENDTRKIYADIYIDDRIIGGFTGWSNIENCYLNTL